jgi:DNA-binding LacI/PurR family transcriptional regulator
MAIDGPSNSRVLKYRRVYDNLAQKISSGEYPAGMKLPPESNLPSILGVSLQTTRQALQELVRSGLLVRRRGDGTYVSDLRRPTLFTGRILKIGVLFPFEITERGLSTEFESRVCKGVFYEWGLGDVPLQFEKKSPTASSQSTMNGHSRGLIIECIGEPPSFAQRHPALPDVRDGGYDGIISIGIIEVDWLTKLLDLGIPTVIVDFPNAPFRNRADQVYADPFEASLDAVRYLATERHLRRIHFLGTKKWMPSRESETRENWQGRETRLDPDSVLRLSAFQAAASSLGLEVSEKNIRFCRSKPEEFERVTDELFALPAEEFPEAMICNDLSQAESILRCCQSRQRQLVTVGVASEIKSQSQALPILLDGVEMGRVAAELLVSRLRRPGRPFMTVGVSMVFKPVS